MQTIATPAPETSILRADSTGTGIGTVQFITMAVK